MEQTSKSLSFLLMASSKWMNKKWKRKQFTFSSSKLPTGECFAYFAYLHFLVVIWSTLGGIGNAGFVVSRAFNLLQADNLLFCTAWESDPGFDNLNFHWVPIFWQTLGKNPILMGYVASFRNGLFKRHRVLGLSVPPICPNIWIQRESDLGFDKHLRCVRF